MFKFVSPDQERPCQGFKFVSTRVIKDSVRGLSLFPQGSLKIVSGV